MSESWQIAARFSSIGEAEAARSALEAVGIETFLADENIIAVDWLYSQALGAVKVMVRAADVETAREVIAAAANGAPASAGDEPPAEAGAPLSEAKCDACGSTQLERIPRFRIFLLFAAAFIGLGAVSGQMALAFIALTAVVAGFFFMPTHRCLDCGERSSPPAPERVIDELPSPADTLEEPCPRCGSLEVHRIDYRRLKAASLFVTTAALIIAPIWWFLPKRRCDSCGFEMR